MRTEFREKFLKNQNGSAVVEFVIYALPLFVPLVIYLTSLNQSSEIQYEARNFARQLARAYVTSPSQDFAEARILSVTAVFVESSFMPKGIDPVPRIEIICSLNPCLSPNGKVEVKVLLTVNSTRRSASATAIQTVDAWRNS